MLDYFGTTVNTATRVQAVAGADEVVLTPVLLEDAEVQAFLAARVLQATPFTAEVHGLTGALELYRLRPAQEMAI